MRKDIITVTSPLLPDFEEFNETSQRNLGKKVDYQQWRVS